MINNLKIIFNLKERIHFFLLIIGFFFAAIVEIVGIASILPFISLAIQKDIDSSNQIINFLYSNFNHLTHSELVYYIGIFLIITLSITNILNALIYWQSNVFVKLQAHSISVRLLIKYTNQSYRFFLSNNVSSLNNNVITEVNRVTEGMLLPAIIALSKLFVVLLIIVLLIILNPTLAMIVFSTFVLIYICIYTVLRKYLDNIGRQTQKLSEEKFQSASNIFFGIKEIKVNEGKNMFIKNFENPSLKFAKNNALLGIISILPRYILETVSFVGIILAVLYFITIENSSSSSYIPLLGVYAIAGYRILPALQVTYIGFTQSRFHMPTLKTIIDDLKLTDEISENYSTNFILPFKDSIKVNDVSLSHNEINILKDIDFEIKKNEKVAIIGATGSGKTSLVDILIGLYSPDRGSILVDGVNIDENILAWRRNIAYVSQNTYLSDDTIEKNIVFGYEFDEINKDKIKDAASKAELKNLFNNDYINFYSEVGNNGAKISGGEKQRIGLARAIYKDANMLILDETTSALDKNTEEKILRTLLNMKKTIVLITHRMDIIDKFEKIIFIKNKKIVAIGKYKDLHDKNAEFRSFLSIYDKNINN